MAVIDVFDAETGKPSSRVKLLAGLARGWKGALRRYRDTQILHQLYQLDAHVLRDMGFEPEDIYAAHDGAIGETDGHRYRGL